MKRKTSNINIANELRHKRFLLNITAHLYNEIRIFRDNNLVPRITWKELLFTATGIHRSCSHGIPHVFASPDILAYATNCGSSRYLAFIEGKTYGADRRIDRARTEFEEQLKRAQQYIADFPEHLEAFLLNEGLTEEEIGDSRIGFVGVIATKNGKGLRELTYFNLFKDKCFNPSQ